MKQTLILTLAFAFGTMQMACGSVDDNFNRKDEIETPEPTDPGSEPGPGEEIIAGAIYASPTGFASNKGTKESPLSIDAAITTIQPGGTIYLLGGEYILGSRLLLSKKGTQEKPFQIFAYPGENPVIDGRNLTNYSQVKLCVGIRIDGLYWHLKGLEITDCFGGGLWIIDGSYNTIEQCVSHHNGADGFIIGYGHRRPGEEDRNPALTNAAYNTFINCDAHHNFDWHTTTNGIGQNADGFNVKGMNGKGNKYIGCRAWCNSDDNYDFLDCSAPLQVINCYAFRAARWEDHREMYQKKTGKNLTQALFEGNGNGFKLGGGYDTPATCILGSRGVHIVRNSIAMENLRNGFDQNNHKYGAWIENCLGASNRINFRFLADVENGYGWYFRNNISMLLTQPAQYADAIQNVLFDDGNSWNDPALKTAGVLSDFVSLNLEDGIAPRQADGSLPDDFGRLTPGSRFIDKGVPTIAVSTGDFQYDPIPYKGSAPDLGAYEF